MRSLVYVLFIFATIQVTAQNIANVQIVGDTTLGEFPMKPNSEWAYNDSGEALGEEIFGESYDDSAWSRGQAPLGYNAPFVTTEVAKKSFVTFRKQVQIDNHDELPTFLYMHYITDDNARFFINGVDLGITGRIVKGKREGIYEMAPILKGMLKPGVNTFAVQVSTVDEDLAFDLYVTLPKSQVYLDNLYNCDGTDDAHISCFESTGVGNQDSYIYLPKSHAFQYIAREGDPYADGNGSFGGKFDFTGYVPIDGSSKHGYLSVNHETRPGGVSISEIKLDTVSGLWSMSNSKSVDFSSLGGTVKNCSGTVTPWGTVITCEEDTSEEDNNNDGYYDHGWCVEIDPTTAKIKEYGTGAPQKLWALGRMDHENVVIAKDNRTVYFGDDSDDGSLYKFVADNAEDLSSGTLYVLKNDDAFEAGEPLVEGGQWIEVPNTSIAERNDVKKKAQELGATLYSGIEDVEISPVTEEIFFAVKDAGKVYAFRDSLTSVQSFRTYVGGTSYLVGNYGQIKEEAWGTGNDNLTFDDRGNLYVLQDGGNNYIWLVGKNHTQNEPQVTVFFHTPAGAEPTGMTFTPDYKYMFLSVQSPEGTKPQADVAGTKYTHNKDVALVIGRSENLGYGVRNRTELKLSILHNNDGESKLLPKKIGDRLVGGAGQFSTLVHSTRSIADNSILLSSGDNFLAGVDFNASLNRKNGKYYDAIVLDSLNYDAICLGNHDFDFGPDVLAKMIDDQTSHKAPYLSANLDYSEESKLDSLEKAGRLLKSTIIEVDNRKIGVIGLTTPLLATISSPRKVKVMDDIEKIAKAEIASLKEKGINKIILITHLQSINNEKALIKKLTDVDVVIAGGGDEWLTNNELIGLPGMEVSGPYPLVEKDAAGEDVYIVTTPGEYNYLGNLTITFDSLGKITEIDEGSGPMLVSGLFPADNIKANVLDSIQAYADNLDKNIIAKTEVDLDGTRASVRTVETNEGDLIADAFLWLAHREKINYDLDSAYQFVALQNGGGIRNNEIIPEGSSISEKKTFEMLPFANKVIVTNLVSPAQTKAILENSVSNVENVDGRFLQVAGIKIVWDTLAPAGSRIYSATLDNGVSIIEKGEVAASAPSIYIITNSYTAGGGDGYETLKEVGVKAIIGPSYQRALYEYLLDGVNGVIGKTNYPFGGLGRIVKGMFTSTDDFTVGDHTFDVSPNPTSGIMKLKYQLATPENIDITLYDNLGKKVITIVSGDKDAGGYSVSIDQSDLQAGTYYMIFRLDKEVVTIPVVKM